MRIVVVGLGSLGTMVIKSLKGLVINDIVLFDNDKVELHNIKSSLIYDKGHV
jgi:tRNA A37 threonylcarbamoyladenosine dehydratase